MQACSDHQRVRLAYRSEAGSEWVADVDPWGVAVRHSRWYLLGRAQALDARRVYRIDRVRSVEVLEDTFSPPADLDPVAMLEEHLAVGWEYDAEVVIDAPVETVARHLPRSLGRLEPIGAQTTRLVGSTSNRGSYAEQLTAIQRRTGSSGARSCRKPPGSSGTGCWQPVTTDALDPQHGLADVARATVSSLPLRRRATRSPPLT